MNAVSNFLSVKLNDFNAFGGNEVSFVDTGSLSNHVSVNFSGSVDGNDSGHHFVDTS